jgi:hypothetical protein
MDKPTDLADSNFPKTLTHLYFVKDPEDQEIYWYLGNVLGRRWVSSMLAVKWANDNGFVVIDPQEIAAQVQEASLTPFNELNAASNVTPPTNSEDLRKCERYHEPKHTLDNVRKLEDSAAPETIWRITTPEARNVFYVADPEEARRFAGQGHKVEVYKEVTQYIAAYEQECQDTMAEGIQFWKNKLQRILFTLQAAPSPYQDAQNTHAFNMTMATAIKIVQSELE